MIQRLQSLYLVLAGLLLALFAAVSDVWASALAPEQAWLGTAAVGLAGLTALVALGAVALYKDRARQVRVTLAAQWLDLALVAAVFVGVYLGAASVDAAVPMGTYLVALLPLVAYVLLRMARQRVAADIERVRSMDRLR